MTGHCSFGTIDAVGTLPERLEAVRKKRGLSKRAWSLKAGLSPSMVSQLVRGAITNPGFATISQLAEAAGVSAAWLAGDEDAGADEQPARWVEVEDRYPSRAVVIAMARKKGIDEAAIEGLATKAHKSSEDPGEKFWWDELMRLVRHSREADRQLAAIDDEPTEAEREAFD